MIGRGARYCPFTLDHTQDKYKRKYDEDLENELRILEELHYHCVSEPLYITELRSALKDQGLLDENMVDRSLKMKDEFKKKPFYQSGMVYLNEQKVNKYETIKSFGDLNVKKKNFEYIILSSAGKESELLGEDEVKEKSIQRKSKELKVKNIDKHIIQKAIARNEFYRFDQIQRYFPTLKSIQSLLSDDAFL